MAIELQVVSVTALVLSEPRERQVYEGRGDDRVAKGRAVDGSGRPLSSVSAVVLAEPIGLLPDATVQLPDSQVTVLVPGAVVGVEGGLSVRLAGGDYGAVRAAVAGGRGEPLDRWADWIGSALAGKGKPGDARAA